MNAIMDASELKKKEPEKESIERVLSEEPRRFEESLQKLKEKSFSNHRVYMEDPVKLTLW